jgi:hypothetical protein
MIVCQTNETKTMEALDAAGKMINNSKKLPRNAYERCFDSESSDYERKRESLDGLNGRYD